MTFAIMSVEIHLKELLYKHSRVVIPGLGTLMAHNCPSEQNAIRHTLTPPRKKITFHASDEGNDCLLENRLRSELGDSSRVAEEMHLTISEWKKTLENESSLHIESIGTLYKNKEGQVLFASNRDTNYLPSSFGLSEVELRPLVREVQGSSPVRAATPAREKRIFLRTAEELEDENSPLLPWLKYASMILLFLSVALTALYFYNQEQAKKERIEKMVNMELTGHIEGSVFYQEPLLLPPVEVEVRNKFHVVAGAYRLRENADKKMQDLRSRDFDAQYLGKNKYELHQVAYGSFPTRKEAGRLLAKLRENGLDDEAWILELDIP